MISKEEQEKLNHELHIAAANARLQEVKELIEKGAEVEGQDRWQRTPLHYAAHNGCLNEVKYLVEEANAEVEVRDDENLTPLHTASKYGKLEVVKYLFLERNALMSINGMFAYPELMQEKMGRETEAQSIFDYFLQNKHRYKPEEIKYFKTKFLKFEMNKEDSKNLKPIVNFL